MFNPDSSLLSHHFAQIAETLAKEPENTQAWTDASQSLGAGRASEPELAGVLDRREAPAFLRMVEEWKSGKRMLPEQDRQLLHRAIKAFKKRLKVTRLDAESGIGGGAMSSGKQSGIVGITPPANFGREVWDELVRQGRLSGGHHGIYELRPEPPTAPR
jgi:hypothetical protein